MATQGTTAAVSRDCTVLATTFGGRSTGGLFHLSSSEGPLFRTLCRSRSPCGGNPCLLYRRPLNLYSPSTYQDVLYMQRTQFFVEYSCSTVSILNSTISIVLRKGRHIPTIFSESAVLPCNKEALFTKSKLFFGARCRSIHNQAIECLIRS